MARWLKQSTSVDVPIGPFVDATDGVTAESALTITQPDIRLKKNGGAWAQKAAAQTLSHEENGWYEVTLDATDTDTLGHLVVAVHESGALPVWCEFMVVPANTYDSLVGGSDFLNAEVAAMAANTLTATAIASDAITAAKVAADVGAEFADAVWDEDIVAAHSTADTGGLILSQLTKRSVTFATAAVAGSIVRQLADDGTATFDRATDSLQALRDRGDAAWTTGGGGSITDLLNVVPLIPESIDIADTATWRLGLMLTNAVDDLPSTAEITPGTISIDRKAIGGTSWTSVVADAACSEAAGLVYFDEVFDSGTGYAEGDSLRITFKSQKITVSANDYEVSDATGRIFYTEVRQTMRGTNNASTLDAAGVRTAVGLASANLDTQLTAIDDLVDTEVAAIKAKTDNLPADPADASDIAAAFAALNDLDAAGIRAAVGLATANLDTQLASVQADTDNIQTRLPAALVSGRMDASVGAMAANTLTASAVATDAGAEIAAAVLAAGDIDGYTLEAAAKILLAAAAGKLSGAATTTVAIRAADDSKARITATVDADGNRSAVTLDGTG